MDATCILERQQGNKTPYSLNITDTSVSFRINNGERSAYIPTSLDTEYTLSRGLDNVIRFYVDGVLYCSSAIDRDLS